MKIHLGQTVFFRVCMEQQHQNNPVQDQASVHQYQSFLHSKYLLNIYILFPLHQEHLSQVPMHRKSNNNGESREFCWNKNKQEGARE